VYGPVRTVVWEGRSCEAPPIPINPQHEFVRKSLSDHQFPAIQSQDFLQFLLPVNRFGIFHGRLIYASPFARL
jgi:hypothetical protein